MVVLNCQRRLKIILGSLLQQVDIVLIGMGFRDGSHEVDYLFSQRILQNACGYEDVESHIEKS